MDFKKSYVPLYDIVSKPLGNISPMTISLKSIFSSGKDSQVMMSEPKHPPSSFMFFMDDFRKEKVGYASRGRAPIMAKLGGEKWKNMTDIDKQPYAKKHLEARLQYDKAMAEYWEKMEESKKNCESKIVSMILADSEESGDEEKDGSDDDEEDSDFEIVKVYKKETGYASKNSKFKKFQVGEMSEYEKLVEKNRAERMAFLQALKMDEAKASLAEAVQSMLKKKQPVQRIKKDPVPIELRPKSKRLVKRSIDLSEAAVYKRAVREAEEAQLAMEEEEERLQMKRKLQKLRQECEKKSRNVPRYEKGSINTPKCLSKGWDGPGSKNCPFFSKEWLGPGSTLQFEAWYQRYVEDINIQGSKPEFKFASYDKSVLTKLTLDENNIARIVPQRICTITWYPSSEYLIVAAGGIYGNLSIWNVGAKSNPHVFRPHSKGITNLRFNPFNPVQMFTSSYDGILRCGDMVKHVFSEVYNASTYRGCTYFDFLSENTCLVSQGNGQVALVDSRAEEKCGQRKHECHEYSIRFVNVHPVNKNCFMTADNRGNIRLWDLRNLQKEPVVNIMHHKSSVNSAFFSPVTGNSILTASLDNTVAIFDSTQLTEDIYLKYQMKQNIDTGSRLSNFQATWLPGSEETFFIGSLWNPPRIELYDIHMNVYHRLKNENLTITSHNAFHPYIPAVAGANASGKVFVFK